jgi:hypothetical protein
VDEAENEYEEEQPIERPIERPPPPPQTLRGYFMRFTTRLKF